MGGVGNILIGVGVAGVVELPYDGEELSMVILLPELGQFQEFENSLTAEMLDTILGELVPKSVDLIMPKFTYRSKFRLAETLSDLGMPIAFSGAANFSGRDGASKLFLDEVIHQAFISVDEAGTEAAAATVVVPVTSGPGPPVEVRINHPFIFMIRDNETDTILFMGRVVKLAA